MIKPSNSADNLIAQIILGIEEVKGLEVGLQGGTRSKRQSRKRLSQSKRRNSTIEKSSGG